MLVIAPIPINWLFFEVYLKTSSRDFLGISFALCLQFIANLLENNFLYVINFVGLMNSLLTDVLMVQRYDGISFMPIELTIRIFKIVPRLFPVWLIFPIFGFLHNGWTYYSGYDWIYCVHIAVQCDSILGMLCSVSVRCSLRCFGCSLASFATGFSPCPTKFLTTSKYQYLR
jgi:hypothetical protein